MVTKDKSSKQKKTRILLLNLFLALLILGCTQNNIVATITISEQAGLSRDIEYVTAVFPQKKLNVSEMLMVNDMESGALVPVQISDTIPQENGSYLKVLFPVAIMANRTKEFQIVVATKIGNDQASDLKLSKDGHSVKNNIYQANFSTEKDERGGQINGLVLKEFDNQLLKRNHNSMHWAPNFSKSSSKHYFNMENFGSTAINTIQSGPYQITKIRSGVTDSVPEIDVLGEYAFYEGLPYFEFSSSMTVNKDVELNLLRNDEMTMDSLFTHVMYTDFEETVSHLKLYGDELDRLVEKPITDDAPWLAFYNMDKGYGYGSIRLEYDNTNSEGNPSTTYKPYTKISKGVHNGRYWNRVLIGEKDVLVKKGDRYKEKNAYLIFKVDESAPEKAMQYYAERLMNPLTVTVEMP
jgi:hypothetical protein